MWKFERCIPKGRYTLIPRTRMLKTPFSAAGTAPSTAAGFEPECRSAFDSLKGALLELYASVDADPASPQDVARQFGVNKTLTWNVSKIMASNDPLAALPQVPGASAIRPLLQAMQRRGADPAIVERVRHSFAALAHVVEVHVGDRATLELIVDGMGRSGADRLELSRKLAFRGNSGLWGVQAKTRLMTVFMAPNAARPDHLDIAIVRGYIGFRRLRSDVRWPIFQTRGWGDETETITKPWRSLESDEAHAGQLPLLTRFSTVRSDELEEVRTEHGTDYTLAPGPIGNTGAVDCFIADYERGAVSQFRTEKDTTGEFGATISAPTERLIFDMIVDERLAFALEPEVRAFGGVFMDRDESALPEGRVPIPVPQGVAMLPGKPPVVATPQVQRYSELVGYVCERMGWSAARFRGCRYELSYPPLGSTILMRFTLPAAPGR